MRWKDDANSLATLMVKDALGKRKAILGAEVGDEVAHVPTVDEQSRSKGRRVGGGSNEERDGPVALAGKVEVE